MNEKAQKKKHLLGGLPKKLIFVDLTYTKVCNDMNM